MRAQTDGWSIENELAAQAVDVLHQLVYVTVVMTGGEATRPVRLPRPSDPKPELPSFSELANFLRE